ncbi:MAG: DNA-formamidopyrimidine glycosylase family protein, partial [Succinivibrio sp.]
MPELPEVEVTRRGIKDHLLHHKIVRIWHDDKKLRGPFSEDLFELQGGYVQSVDRRAKYIIIATDHGSLLIHLGMTGHLSVTNAQKPRNPHDHFEIEVDTGSIVRMNDIRRFGMVVFYPKGISPYEENPLSSLGP